MRGTAAQGNLRAKTGTLTSVMALSGFVGTAGRDRFAFTSLVSNFVGLPPRDIEDALGVTLAGSVNE